jgi:penicillin-binding protein 1C
MSREGAMTAGTDTRMRRSLVWRVLAALGVLASLATATLLPAVAVIAWNMPPLPLERVAERSTTVVDRNGRLLRAYTTSDDHWRLPVRAADIDPTYLKMLFAFEDRRFRSHFGIDPHAIARVASELLRHGRLISGSSTLTMQTARLIEGRHERTAAGKVRQMLRALELERRFTKTEILSLYLELAPFGGNLEGVRAASLAYLGKEPQRLSLAEGALLVAIPQSPAARRPDRSPEAAKRARNRVLARAAALGVIDAKEAAAAMREPVPAVRRDFPRLAPHLSDTETDGAPPGLVHRLTIDAGIQQRLEALARDHARAHGQALSTAVIVVEHATGEVIAHVGSAGYLDEGRAGAIDMLRAVRSPGSTLKPLVYGLAFDGGIAHPETMIEDRPARFGGYSPRNFDHDYAGTVTIREALAKSLNVPAVKVLDVVGAQKLAARMQGAGADPMLPKDAEPSLAMALGGVGLRATDLAQLYAAIARGGAPVALTWRTDAARKSATAASTPTADGARPAIDQRPLTRLLSPVAAWYLADILKSAPPPINARAGEIAYKTGTSYGYRDAWSAGFDGRHAVVVWVGRPDGASVPGLSGRLSAAPLLFDAFQRLAERRTPLPPAPHGVVRASGRDLPPALRSFGDPREAAIVAGFRDPGVAITFPQDRTVIDWETAGETGLMLKAEGGALPLTWLLDGAPIESDPLRREALIETPPRGFLRIAVIDAKGRADRVTLRVK